MPSCLGIYTDKNMVKYAKVSWNKNDESYTVDSYGIEFYDNMAETIQKIASQTEMENGPLGLALSSESYFTTLVFSSLKRKDMSDLIFTEYNEKFGKKETPMSIIDMRYKLAKNVGVLDKNLAVSVFVSKSELARINRLYEDYRIASIEPLSVSLKNLFENDGIDEEAAVVNIENKTTVTIFHRSEIQHIETIDIGTEEIIAGLVEKYNSVAKAYEACRKVSVYLDGSTIDVGDEEREILDAIIPVLYDIRQRTEEIIKPFKDLKTIYITGMGAAINNTDLYFKQLISDIDCQVLIPFFLKKNFQNKEIAEVTSALALAIDGLGLADGEFDFNRAAKKAAGINSFRELARRYNLDEKKEELNRKKEKLIGKAKDFITKINSPQPKKKKRKKVKISVAEGNTLPKEKEKVPLTFGMIDLWLIRACVLTVSTLLIYSFSALYASKVIAKKNSEVSTEIVKNNAVISAANSDATYLKDLADNYVSIKDKLSGLIEKINEETKKSFDIPNFLSKLMFIMPANVKVTSIDISNTGNVMLKAESGQYAELGYFVSRAKLENLLLDVDMEVQSVESNIKIVVSGVLP